MENFCKNLKEHTTKMINYERKTIRLTHEENKLYHEQNICFICKKGFSIDDNNKKYHKVMDHCHYTGKYIGTAHNIFNLKYKTSKEIPVVFHNG